MFYETRIIILLAAGNKTTQVNDIKTARSRIVEVLRYGEKLL
jgi:putative component of toxin-antitoxin plasmid stabilization module